MCIMLIFHQFEVLKWKHRTAVESRKHKKNRESQARHRPFESACENPSLPLHFCSMEVEWCLLPFPFKYLKKSSIEKCIQLLLNSYTYQNNLIQISAKCSQHFDSKLLSGFISFLLPSKEPHNQVQVSSTIPSSLA